MSVTGADCDPWQAHVLDGALGERPDGRWTAFEVALIVPRQNGKNFILEARELAGLFFFGEKEIIHSAHRLDTARDAFRKFEYRVRSTPALLEQVQGYAGQDPWDRRIPGIRTGAGEMSIQLANGNKIQWKTRSETGGRGFTGDLIILDEALYLSTEEVAAMMPTMAARSMEGNPQIWYTSSAGLASSEQLARIRERGLDEAEERLAYFEWSAPDDADSDDIDAWYIANPGMGLRISEEYVAESEYQAMEDEQFRRERLGIWAPLGGEQTLSAGQWEKQTDKDSVADVGSIFFGVDVTPSRDSAAIVAVAVKANDASKIHVELIDYRVGTEWVAPRLRQLQDGWNPRGIVVNMAGAAGTLIPEFRRERLKIMQITSREYLQACALFLDRFRTGAFSHIGQENFSEAVVNGQKKMKGDSLFTWAQVDPSIPICPLVAATCGLAGFEKKRKPEGTEKVSKGWRIIGL